MPLITRRGLEGNNRWWRRHPGGGGEGAETGAKRLIDLGPEKFWQRGGWPGGEVPRGVERGGTLFFFFEGGPVLSIHSLPCGKAMPGRNGALFPCGPSRSSFQTPAAPVGCRQYPCTIQHGLACSSMPRRPKEESDALREAKRMEGLAAMCLCGGPIGIFTKDDEARSMDFLLELREAEKRFLDYAQHATGAAPTNSVERWFQFVCWLSNDVQKGDASTNGEVAPEELEFGGMLWSNIRSDNGPEFLAYSIQEWMKQNKIRTLYITPGLPWNRSEAQEASRRLPAGRAQRGKTATLNRSTTSCVTSA